MHPDWYKVSCQINQKSSDLQMYRCNSNSSSTSWPLNGPFDFSEVQCLSVHLWQFFTLSWCCYISQLLVPMRCTFQNQGSADSDNVYFVISNCDPCCTVSLLFELFSSFKRCLWSQYFFIHSFILAISIAPLQVHYYSEAFPTTARILYRSFTPKHTGNCN